MSLGDSTSLVTGREAVDAGGFRTQEPDARGCDRFDAIRFGSLERQQLPFVLAGRPASSCRSCRPNGSPGGRARSEEPDCGPWSNQRPGPPRADRPRGRARSTAAPGRGGWSRPVRGSSAETASPTGNRSGEGPGRPRSSASSIRFTQRSGARRGPAFAQIGPESDRQTRRRRDRPPTLRSG